MCAHPNSGKRGFSLLEAVVAVAIVGVASVSVLAAFGGEVRTADRARTALEAEALAVDRLTTVRLLTLDELDDLPDSVSTGRFTPPFDRYRWEIDVRRLSGQRDLHQVSVLVAWPEGEYALETRLYRPPPVSPSP